MRKMTRAHPATILVNLGRVFFLIVIPLIRGLISAFQGGFSRWLDGAWFDVLVFLLIVGIAVAAWLTSSYRFDSSGIHICSGMLFRRHRNVPRENITTLALKEPPFLRPFHAVSLSADTLGGSFRRADFTLLIWKNQAEDLIRGMGLLEGEPRGQVYRPSTALVAALSMLTSSSSGGILLIATFISQSGKLLGRRFSGMLIGTFEETARTFAFGLPPAAAATGYLLLAGWLAGFFLSFARYKNFALVRRAGSLEISGGVFTKRRYYVRSRDVNFIDIRQNIPAKMLKLQSLYLSAVGYGKRKDDFSCVIPSEHEKYFDVYRDKVFPEMDPAARQYKPEKRGMARFLSAPSGCILIVCAAAFTFRYLFPSWSGLILFAGLMAAIPALFFLITRIFDFLTCGLAVSGEHYVLRYSVGFNLHTVVMPIRKAVRVELRQGFFQKSGPYCDLLIHSESEGRIVHRCRSLVKAELEALFWGP